MAQLRIKIGAAADQRSFDVVFGQLEKRGHKATEKVAKDWAKLFKTLEMRADKAGAHMEKALSGKGKGGSGKGQSADDFARPAVEGSRKATVKIGHELRKQLVAQKAGDLEAHRLKLRLIEQEANAKLKAIRRSGAQEAREADRTLRSFANRTSHRTTRFLTQNAPVTQVAGNFARGVASGAGVDMSFSGGIARNIDVESQLGDALNSARFAGQDLDMADVQGRVRSTSNNLGMSRGETTGGVLAFQKKTGDLGLGLDIMGDLGKIGVATGTKFNDMLDAAGDVSNVLGDVPDKGRRIVDVFETIAGQGAKGAVEISDLASGMAKLGAAAGRFEGDAGENLKKMGALAQFARATGGAASASEASNAVGRFVDQLSTNARAKEFKAAGVDIFSKSEPGQFIDPFEVIKKSLVATKGDPLKLGKLFASSIGKKPVQAMASEYLKAGGAKDEKAGLAAVEKMIAEQMQGAALNQGDVDKALEEALGSTSRQVQLLNNQWDDAVEEMQGNLVPALQKATPHIISFGETVSDVATWSIDNPKKAIAAAIGFSIARAGIESTMRTAIDKAITSGSALIQRAVSTSIGRSIATMSAITLVATAVHLYTEDLNEQVTEGQTDAVDRSLALEDKIKGFRKKVEGGEELSLADLGQLREALNQIAQRKAAAEHRNEQGMEYSAVTDWFGNLVGTTNAEQIGQEQVDATQIDRLEKQQAELLALLGGDVKVRVVNTGDFPKPEAGSGPGGGTGYDLPVPGP